MCAHGGDKRFCAGIEPDVFVIDALQRRKRQILQKRHAFAQRAGELDLAAHGALRDRGDFPVNAGDRRQLVHAFAGDDG